MTITTSSDPAAIDAAASENLEVAVGYCGCPRTNRLLRVSIATTNRQRLRVECPDCDQIHESQKPLTRALRSGEDPPVLIEIPPSAPEEAPAGFGSKSRNQVSDPEVIAGVPTVDTPAGEVAPTLGFSGTKTLTRRLKSMNQRAEKRGVSAPFVVRRTTIPGVRGTVVLVRKSGA